MEKIGIIAGNKKLPILFAEAAKKKNYYIVAVAIKGDTSLKLKKYVDKIYWLGLNEFSRMLEIFKLEGLTKIVMAGQISPARLFKSEITKDAQLRELLDKIEDKKADTIFGAIAEKLSSCGFELLNSTTFLENLIPKKGTLTEREPTFSEWDDIYFGMDLAKAIAYLDIGQTVAVKNKAILAVEALEGTDNLIRRAGLIAKDGITLVKVSKPKQDMRFDIPVVGLNTVKNMTKSGINCLALEADKTLFIDKDSSIALANKKGVSVVAL